MFPIEAAAQSGQLTVLNASDAVTLVGGADGLSSERFDRSVGALVRQLASRARSLRVFGEVVDVFAERGEFDAALRLEALWNALIDQVPMALLCGYSAPRYREPGRSEEFQRICGAHSHQRLSTRRHDCHTAARPLGPPRPAHPKRHKCKTRRPAREP